MLPYTPADWYWVVNGSTTQVYSSKTGDYLPLTAPVYVGWQQAGGVPTRIASEAELGDVLAPYAIRPVAANVLDSYKDAHSKKLTIEVVAKVLFNLVNEVRALKGQPAINAAQFRAYVKGLM